MEEVKKYNFNSKQKYTNEQLKVFEFIRSKMSKLISRSLTEELNTNVNVHLESVEQMSYDEFINSMGIRTLYIPYTQGNPKDINLLYISTDLAFVSMDMLMGGDGNYCDTEKELTELDKKILKYIVIVIVECIFKFLKPKGKIEVESNIGNIEESYVAQQNIYLEDIVVVSKYNVKIKDRNYKLGLCNAYNGRKSATLEMEQWMKNDDIENNLMSQTDNNFLNENIGCIELNIIAELGKSKMNIKEFMELTEGDIIRLDTKLTDQITIYIEELETYYAKPGTKLGKNSALILNLVEKLVKDDE